MGVISCLKFFYDYIKKETKTHKKGCRCCSEMGYVILIAVALIWPYILYIKIKSWFQPKNMGGYCSGMVEKLEETELFQKTE